MSLKRRVAKMERQGKDQQHFLFITTTDQQTEAEYEALVAAERERRGIPDRDEVMVFHTIYETKPILEGHDE